MDHSDKNLSFSGAANGLNMNTPIELTPDVFREIENPVSKITVHGARYPEHLEQMAGR